MSNAISKTLNMKKILSFSLDILRTYQYIVLIGMKNRKFLGSGLASSRSFNKEILYKIIRSDKWRKRLKEKTTKGDH